MVQKKDSGFCPILDLHNINGFITMSKFPLTILDNILPSSDWFSVIDLRDTYVHTHPYYRHFIFFGSYAFHFKTLAFGLSSTPCVFTKCMVPAAAYLCTQGVTSYP